MKFLKWMLFDMGSSLTVATILFWFTLFGIFIIPWSFFWKGMALLHSAFLISVNVNLMKSSYMTAYKKMKRDALKGNREKEREENDG